jgi:putative chitinase
MRSVKETTMSVVVTLDQLARLAPQSEAVYRAAFGAGQPVLARYGIAARRLRVIHFMAQVLHESGALTLQFENLRYSAARLVKIWPRRFQPLGPLDPEQYANDPEKLANEVYGGRMGNCGPGEGYLYRGRGLLQLTGKDSYARATTFLQQGMAGAPDLTREPDAVLAPAWCLNVAAAEWAARGCNQAADEDDVAKVTQLINGAEIGLAERIMWTAKTRKVWRQG